MNGFAQKSFKILMALLVVYALLVATHKGEFWPFSIYPMFSQAGKPWTRAIVRDVTHSPDSILWQTTDFDHLEGEPVELKKAGANQIDYANFVSKTKDWDHKRKMALIKLFGKKNLGDSRWMVMKVHGWLNNSDSVKVEVIPFLLVTRDSVLTNPSFSQETYRPGIKR